MSKHTPGPWGIGMGCEIIGNAVVVSHIYGIDSCDNKEKQEALANAHLIAAAPELLEACEKAHANLARAIAILADEGHRLVDEAALIETLWSLKRAIKKAQGESSDEGGRR